MPSATWAAPFSNDGVYEIAVAPSNTNVIYVAYKDNIYVSINKGTSFVLTGFSPQHMRGNEGQYRVYPFKMMVDPVNADVCIVVTQSNGAYVTTNGTSGASSTWAAVSGSVANNDSNMVGIVGFDTSSGTGGSPTQTNICYIAVSGTGVYKRTTPGGSFTLQNTTGMPTQCVDMRVAADGKVYCVTADASHLWQLSGTTWTDLVGNLAAGMSGNLSAVVCHPTTAGTLLAITFGNGYQESTNFGVTWVGQVNVTANMTATDVPYLATLFRSGTGIGIVSPIIDPSNTAVLWVSGQQGIFTTTLPLNASGGAAQPFTSVGAGIENLVACRVLIPPGNSAVMTCSEDCGVLRNTNKTKYVTAQSWCTTVFLAGGWWADYASNNSSFLVALTDAEAGGEQSAFSSDGGSTWTKMTAFPAFNGVGAGCIAAADSNHWVWAPVNNDNVFRTANGGSSWSQLDFTGAGTSVPVAPTNSVTGWGNNKFLNRCIVAADRVNIGTFYLQNGGAPGFSCEGIFKSTDNGATWTYTANTITQGDQGFGNAKLLAVPGNAGHLFLSPGSSGSGGDPASNWPHNKPFVRSTDGGTTWSSVLGDGSHAILEPWSHGIGAIAPGKTYPSIYVYGFVPNPIGSYTFGGVTYDFGVYRSIDNCVTWQRLGGQYPIGWFDAIRSVDGDINNYGYVYIGTQGSGYEYGYFP